MNMIKILVGGAILGFVIDALAPSLPANEIQKKDCEILIECEPGKAMK